MAESTYKVIELVGTSHESWEKAVMAVVAEAARSVRDLRIVEVEKLDATVHEGKVETFRARVKLSFKHEEPR